MITDIESTFFNVYTCGVSDDLYYSTSFNINDFNCVFTFSYNSRLNQRMVNVVTSDGIVLLSDTHITLARAIPFNINFELLGNYKTTLYFRKINSNIPLDILKWSESVEMFITSLPEDQKDQDMYNDLHIRNVI